MPLDIQWSPLARRRLQDIHEYISQDRPRAAELLAMRILAAVDTLRNYPHLGRKGSNPGTRELVIGTTPYIVIYRVDPQQIRILTIWHGAQNRKP